MSKGLKSFFVLLTAFSMYFTQASTPFVQSPPLQQAYANLKYHLEVEWDQEDILFYKEHMAQFMQTIQELRKKGLADDELMDFVRENIKDQKLIDHLTLLTAGLDTSEMDQDELMDFILDISRNNPSGQGASWASIFSRKKIIPLGITVAFTVVLTALLISRLSDDDTKTDEALALGAIAAAGLAGTVMVVMMDSSGDAAPDSETTP